MNEDLLSYIWQYRRYNLPLITTEGHEITILKPGLKNLYSGPDFHESRLVLEGRTWAGSVELHVKSSDFLKHGHQNDPAYTHLILHVVWEHDMEIPVLQQHAVPTVALKHQTDKSLLRNWEVFRTGKDALLCRNDITNVPALKWNTWLDRLAVERLERKNDHIESLLKRYTGDWEQTLYHMLLEGFGMKANKSSFGLIATALPFAIIKKHGDKIDEILALIQAVTGVAVGASQTDLQFLRSKYQLTNLGATIFKTGTVRPANSPSNRLRQLASFLTNKRNLVSAVLQTLQCNQPLTQSFTSGVNPGSDFINHLYINVIVPFVFCYATHNGPETLRESAVDFLRLIDAEQNKVTRVYSDVGRKSANAFESQAQLELFNYYCSNKRCLICNVGISVLGKK